VQLDDIDLYSMQNIARFLVRDPRDVGALRLSCKYIAAAVNSTFIQPVNIIITIIRTLYDPKCTTEQVYNLVQDYPDEFKNNGYLMNKLINLISPAHMRIISNHITIANNCLFNFNYYLYPINIFFKFMHSHCDETVADDIVTVSQKYYWIESNKIAQNFDEARNAYAQLSRACDMSAKISIIHNINLKHICNSPEYHNKILAFLYKMFCPDIIFEPTIHDINNAYAVTSICTDAARMMRIIEVYGKKSIYSLMISHRSANCDDITFWRDLRRIAFARPNNDALFNKNIFVQICAQYTYYIINMINAHYDADYRAFWRDVFMRDKAIYHVVKKGIAHTFLHICNSSDIDELIAANLISMTDFDQYDLQLRNVCMYNMLIERNVINETNCAIVFKRIMHENNYISMINDCVEVSNIIQLFINTFPKEIIPIIQKIISIEPTKDYNHDLTTMQNTLKYVIKYMNV